MKGNKRSLDVFISLSVEYKRLRRENVRGLISTTGLKLIFFLFTDDLGVCELDVGLLLFIDEMLKGRGDYVCMV